LANDITGIRSLKLSELLGSTMAAVIGADALAAKATLEYVETVGFQAPSEEEGGTTTTLAGDLRMAQFRYVKRDENEELAEFVAEVPVLSLVPIPALQVEKANFSLAVKIDDVVKTETPAAGPAPSQPKSRFLKWLRPAETQLVGRPAASSTAKSEETRSTHHLEVEITLTQADITVGMERVFQLMDNAILDRKAPST
jgi:hypothetical protein